MSDPRIIVALDYPSPAKARAMVARLDPRLCRIKIGKELFTNAGPALAEEFARRGFGVFLDLKFHDIPNTVAGACKAAARLGAWMINVHALGGRAMMEAARAAVAECDPRPKLVAVTVLTSMGGGDLAEVGIEGDPQQAVSKLARLAQDCGLDGVVCSAQEAPALKQACGGNFLLVTPGIRLAGAAADDQARVMTPEAAVAAGADYLVIGRPVTQAADPLSVLRQIGDAIAGKGSNA